MGDERKAKREPYLRLSPEERATFLEVLSQTGNRRAAALAIGVDARLMDQRREFDPVLDRQWAEAVEQAHRRLSGASGPFDCSGGRLNVIRRGKGGRLQLIAAGPKRWTKKVDDAFFAALAMCGCLAAAARAVGFSESCVYQRRRRYPEFARRLEEALEDAEVAIEFRLAVEGGPFGLVELAGEGKIGMGTSGESDMPSPQPPPASGRGRFDREFALRFLKWREEKRRGGGRRDHRRVRPPPSIEEVTESIVRKIEAIRRHEAREAERKRGRE